MSDTVFDTPAVATVSSGPSTATIFVVSAALVILIGVIVWAATAPNAQKAERARRRRRQRLRKRRKVNANFISSVQPSPATPQSLHNTGLQRPDEIRVKSSLSSAETTERTRSEGTHTKLVSSLDQAFLPLLEQSAPKEVTNFDVNQNVPFVGALNRHLKSETNGAALADRALTETPERRQPARQIGHTPDAFYKEMRPAHTRDVATMDDVPFGGSQYFSELLESSKAKSA